MKREPSTVEPFLLITMSEELDPTKRKGSTVEGSLFIERPSKKPREELGTKEVPRLPDLSQPPPETPPLETEISELLKLFMDLQHHKRMVEHLQHQAARSCQNARTKELWDGFEKYSKTRDPLAPKKLAQTRKRADDGAPAQPTKSSKKREKLKAKKAAKSSEEEPTQSVE
jgi:hypothetical protein